MLLPRALGGGELERLSSVMSAVYSACPIVPGHL
eukprot:COSAG02_NODE_21733_length_777_cov_0.790560_1_plen_33_part_10